MQLPHIMEEAKPKPLSFNPETHEYIYYDEVKSGKKKLIPLDDLDNQDLKALSVKRYENMEYDRMISSLNGEEYKTTDIVKEINANTELGKSFLNGDLNYLRFYLESFPAEAFERK